MTMIAIIIASSLLVYKVLWYHSGHLRRLMHYSFIVYSYISPQPWKVTVSWNVSFVLVTDAMFPDIENFETVFFLLPEYSSRSYSFVSFICFSFPCSTFFWGKTDITSDIIFVCVLVLLPIGFRIWPNNRSCTRTSLLPKTTEVPRFCSLHSDCSYTAPSSKRIAMR
jgi:hypothetical protein